MTVPLVPMLREHFTNSFSFSASTSLRIIRAKGTQLVPPMIKISTPTLLPATIKTTMAIKILGMAKNASVTRIITLSIQPP